MISLHRFCKENGLSKGSVHARCKEFSIDTSSGLSDEDVAVLEAHFKIRPKSVKVEVDPPEVQAGTLDIYTSAAMQVASEGEYLKATALATVRQSAEFRQEIEGQRMDFVAQKAMRDGVMEFQVYQKIKDQVFAQLERENAIASVGKSGNGNDG